MARSRSSPATPIHPGEPYSSWLDEQRKRQLTEVRARVKQDKQGLISVAGPGGELPDPDRPRVPTGTVPAKPLTSFHAYVNSRPQDWNTCGQAAIGSMLDFYGKDPFNLPRVNGRWRDGDIIDALVSHGFGPDVIGGVFGTSPHRIRDALKEHGAPNVKLGHSGVFLSGWVTEWNRLLAYVYYSAIPVPVLLGIGVSAHWPILWKMTRESKGMMLHLKSWSPEWGPNPMPADDFQLRWACMHLPWTFNHAAIYTGSPKITF